MDDQSDSADALPDSLEREIDALCLQFELAWRSRQTPSIEAYVARVSDVARPAALRDLIAVEADLRRAAGQRVAPEEYRERFPDDAVAVDTAFGDLRQSTECGPAAVDVVHPEVSQPPIPDTLGRYQIQERLATGAFGEVYLAKDQQLDRLVALKMPRRGRFSSEAEMERFVEEARTAAQLNHLAIVTVYDVTRHGDQVCIVQEYVAGQDLARRLRESALLPEQASELMIAVAEAVAFAHQRGFIHRDLKPDNILLDDGGRPRVADFGLAIHEGVQHLRKGEMAGTPVYMSPEQVRGETHRLDGRSDLWSLGVIFYEILTGRLPFSGETNAQQFDEIKYRDPKPPRQIMPDVPSELERICLKCLSKRVTDRYSSGIELADDLRHWLARDVQEIDRQFEPRQTRVVPKGLRSFSEEDADFFLELLPGPRDRNGLPESVRFWKTRIEQTDVDRSFAVGLIYGPSGCGKSSLVRAGLLPRLAAHVVTVCVDAAATGTEERLIQALQRFCPDIPGDISLPVLFQSLREGNWIADGKKTLIVLDQFEQWLHANGGQGDKPLVQALRHCDGTRVQCVVLVRDEFWLATSRFLRELEIDLVEGTNSYLVDLFDPLHARTVLAEFGRAYGRLDENLSTLTDDQEAFLDQAVEGLVQDGKVMCVRLALLADMMKGRPWTVASLQQVGGPAGLGVSFLDETFSLPTAPAQHRIHQQASRRVLRALLPESITDIKGRMRSYGQLREASGYASRAREFEDVVRILDGELRLISPADPEYVSSARECVETTETTGRYYQLTHDYLVSPLREWLTGKQRETRRGRTELRLAERAAAWQAQPDSRHLPSWWECLHILVHVPRRNWTQTQRNMMAKAGRYFSLRGLAWVTTFVVLGALAVETYGRFRAAELLQSLARVEFTKVGAVLDDIAFYRRWTRPRVDGATRSVSDDPQYRLRLSLARLRLSGEREVIDSLYEQMLEAEPDVFAVLRDELADHQSTFTDRLWRELQGKTQPSPRRYRAACALASDSTADDPRWSSVVDFVAGQMIDAVAMNPSSYTSWRAAMQPVRFRLLTPLQSIARDPDRLQTERAFACSLLADYAHDRPELLVELMEMVDESQVAMVFSQLVPHRAKAIGLLQESMEELPSSESSETEREDLARGQARAAAALLTLGPSSDRIWRFLRHDADPGRRSHLIHCFARVGVDPGVLTGQLDQETNVSIRRALILSLGEFDPNALSVEQRDSVIAQTAQLFRDDPDAGIHGAAEWLLRHWGARRAIQPTRSTRSEGRTEQARPWTVDGQGHTMAVLGPDTFVMGSPETELGHFPTEGQHRRRIGRRFAIATKEVTVGQFQRFVDDQKINFRAKTNFARFTEVPDGPQVYLTWYLATQYCNWLSDREQIPPSQWCYLPNANGEYAAGMKPAVGYLSLLGYRLPSVAEWEYACRAGAETSRYYGETEDLLEKYAWYRPNSHDRAHAVGMLKPNDFGLFDMHGNAFEWCHNRVFDYPAGSETVDDGEDLTPIDRTDRMLRGGTFVHESRIVRCALRYRDPPHALNATYGLRVAKTVDATGEKKHFE